MYQVGVSCLMRLPIDSNRIIYGENKNKIKK